MTRRTRSASLPAAAPSPLRHAQGRQAQDVAASGSRAALLFLLWCAMFLRFAQEHGAQKKAEYLIRCFLIDSRIYPVRGAASMWLRKSRRTSDHSIADRSG